MSKFEKKLREGVCPSEESATGSSEKVRKGMKGGREGWRVEGGWVRERRGRRRKGTFERLGPCDDINAARESKGDGL